MDIYAKRVQMRQFLALFLACVLISSADAQPSTRPGSRPSATATQKITPSVRPNAQPTAPKTTVKKPSMSFDKPAATDKAKEESKKNYEPIRSYTPPVAQPKPYTPPAQPKTYSPPISQPRTYSPPTYSPPRTYSPPVSPPPVSRPYTPIRPTNPVQSEPRTIYIPVPAQQPYQPPVVRDTTPVSVDLTPLVYTFLIITAIGFVVFAVVVTRNTKFKVNRTNEKPIPAKIKSEFFNPLNAAINQAFRLKEGEYLENSFRLNAIRSVNRQANGNEHPVTDYELVDLPVEGEPVNIRLRIVPTGLKENPHHAIILKQIGSCAYDKNFHDGLSYDKNKGIFQEGDVAYSRVNDLKEPWEAAVVIRSEADLVKENLIYWDYWRQTESDETEFYFVDMDKATGFFTFWVGKLVNPESILVV